MSQRLIRLSVLVVAALALSLTGQSPTVGNPFQIAAILGAALVAVLVRGRKRPFGWSVAAVALLALAIAARLGLPEDLRVATTFIFQLAGFGALALSVLVEIPRHHPDGAMSRDRSDLLVIRPSAPVARTAPGVTAESFKLPAVDLRQGRQSAATQLPRTKPKGPARPFEQIEH